MIKNNKGAFRSNKNDRAFTVRNFGLESASIFEQTYFKIGCGINNAAID